MCFKCSEDVTSVRRDDVKRRIEIMLDEAEYEEQVEKKSWEKNNGHLE